MTDTPDIAEIVREYRDSILAWAEAQSNSHIANRLYDQNRSLYRILRASEGGRAAITDLLNDPIVAVRMMAAVHCLAWVPDLGVSVLEQIEHDRSLYGIDAKYTLRSYRAGTLSLD